MKNKYCMIRLVILLILCPCFSACIFSKEEFIANHYNLFPPESDFENKNYYIGSSDSNFEIINVSKIIWSKDFIAAYSVSERKGKGWYLLITKTMADSALIDRNWIGPFDNITIQKLIAKYHQFKTKKLTVQMPFDTHEQLRYNSNTY